MAVIDKIINDDFVWNAVSSAIAGKAKPASKGFLKMNCPMCVMRGEPRPDRKQRLGIRNNHPGVGFSCFNCKARGTWVPGETLTDNFKQFMYAIGIPDLDIKRLNHKAYVYRSMFEASPAAQAMVPASFTLDFPAKALPAGAATFEEWAGRGCTDPNFIRVAEYLYGRGDEVAAASTYYWTPESRTNPADHRTEAQMNRRVIIPFYRGEKIVGYTARAADIEGQPKITPKYSMDSPNDYLFNNHVMEINERKYLIVVEGAFDALAISGVSPMGSNMTDRQASWIDSTGKIPILVPDPDSAGQNLIDVAIKRKWHVAFPRMTAGSQRNWWDQDIHDCTDAVKRYGRLYTLTSILKSSTDAKVVIEMKRKML